MLIVKFHLVFPRHSHIVLKPETGTAREIRDATALINKDDAVGLYKVLKGVVGKQVMKTAQLAIAPLPEDL